MFTEWEQRKAVRRMQPFIEDHLGEPVTLADLARAAHYSPYHSARMFKEMTGRTPFEYLRMRRLSAAAVELSKEGRRVVDVAFDFVFDSHEGFTRAFARQFGVPPSRLQEVAWPAHLFHPEPATEFYRGRQKGMNGMAETVKTGCKDNAQARTQTVFVQILERPRRKLLFLPAKNATHYFAYCEEVGCEVWDDLESADRTGSAARCCVDARIAADNRTGRSQRVGGHNRRRQPREENRKLRKRERDAPACCAHPPSTPHDAPPDDR